MYGGQYCGQTYYVNKGNFGSSGHRYRVPQRRTALFGGFHLGDLYYSGQSPFLPPVNLLGNAEVIIGQVLTSTTSYAELVGSSIIEVGSNVEVTFDSGLDGEVLGSSRLKTLKIGKQYGPVTSVILGRVPQNDNVVISSQAPEANIITGIDIDTNLFTIVGNAMSDGNLVRLESTGDLPEPLLANTNYYVYTNGSADSFALTPTYADGVNGTNVIDLITSGSGTMSLARIATQEVQINNNQIVDDDRQTLLPPLYEALVGLEWNEVKAETVGLGWHEVGDVVKFVQGDTIVEGFIDEVHLTLAGSIKETLVSKVPDVATINYQTAGGVIKTLYNTEIKVDKQQNEITSVVSQQEVSDTNTATSFSEIYQNLSNILLTIQQSGGGNILLNSVGFARISDTDNSSVAFDKLEFWEYNPSYDIATHGSVQSYSSSESQNNGGISGQVVEMSGASVYIEQRVNVAVNTPMSFGVRLKNAIGSGTATITLSNDSLTETITIDDLVNYNWEEFKIENFISSLAWLDIRVQVSAATAFAFTDLRLLYGTSVQAWVQSPAEILSANVQFTKNGMRIFDSVHDTETQVTYNEFSTRRKADGKVLFEADDTGIVANDFSVKGQTTYFNGDEAVIKQITIPDSSALAGIAFIKVG